MYCIYIYIHKELNKVRERQQSPIMCFGETLENDMDPTKNDNHVKWYLAAQVILSAAHIYLAPWWERGGTTIIDYDVCTYSYLNQP